MATTEERLGTLEVRVDNLETWAGPGQATALAAGQLEIRAELAKVRQTQDRHTRMLADLTADVSELKSDVSGLKSDVAVLKADVAVLKADMAEVKDAVREILGRLPAT
jgi:chromosome segregation ATPase